MNIFLSYGGFRSQLVAEALREWLPLIFDEVQPWVATRDIEAGARWLDDISEKLVDTTFGIICLTSENLNNRWIHFEAGAIAKSINKSKVIPYLLDINCEELDYPIKQFQAKIANGKSTYEMLFSINENLRNPISEDNLKERFSVFWPKLENNLKSILNKSFEFEFTRGCRILGSKREASPIYDSCFAEAKHLIQILGLSLRNVFSDKVTPEVVVQKIKNGCNIEFLILNPSSSILKQRSFEEKAPPDLHYRNYCDVKNSIQNINEILISEKDDWEHFEGAIDIKLHETLPYFSYFRADSHIIVGFYNRDRRCHTSAAFEFEMESRFFHEFVGDFSNVFAYKTSNTIFSFRGGANSTYKNKIEKFHIAKDMF